MKTLARKLLRALLVLPATPWLLAGCVTMPVPPASYEATLPAEAPAASQAGGAIYQAGNDLPLFDNPIAHRVGDVLTITLQEKTSAVKSATTSTDKKTGLAVPAPTVLGHTLNYATAVSNENTFAGKGDSAQSNELSGSITVTVARRLSNGSLLVRGQRWITLNQGREFIRIQGIVRPLDIAPDNTVASSKVGDARIEYGGQGTLADANTKGWLARFFDSALMPF